MRSIKTTIAHHHSSNNPVDLLWEALKLRLPTTIVVQYKITIPTTIISWQPQHVSGSMSVRVIQGGRPQQLLPPGRRYVLKTNVNHVLYWYVLKTNVNVNYVRTDGRTDGHAVKRSRLVGWTNGPMYRLKEGISGFGRTGGLTTRKHNASGA